MSYRISGAEPQVKTPVYAYDGGESLKKGRAEFIGLDGKHMSVEDIEIHEMVLIPSRYFQDVEEKNQRCEVWK